MMEFTVDEPILEIGASGYHVAISGKSEDGQDVRLLIPIDALFDIERQIARLKHEASAS